MLFEVRRIAEGVAAPVLRKEYPVRVLSPPRTCATNVGWPEPLRQSTCSAGSANILHETAHVPNRSTTTSVTSGLVAHTAVEGDVHGVGAVDRAILAPWLTLYLSESSSPTGMPGSLQSWFCSCCLLLR